MTTTLEYGAITAEGELDGDTLTIAPGALGPIALDTHLALGEPRRFARITEHVAADDAETLTLAWED